VLGLGLLCFGFGFGFGFGDVVVVSRVGAAVRCGVEWGRAIAVRDDCDAATDALLLVLRYYSQQWAPPVAGWQVGLRDTGRRFHSTLTRGTHTVVENILRP
jgi:hypothetical protein